MKKPLGILVLGLLFCNAGFADHRSFDCSVGLGTPPWENPDLHDDPNAPWNHWLHADSLVAPWNGIFCSEDDVNEYLRENGFSEKYFWIWF